MGYRAVVREENWANCPFKRKLYFPFHSINNKYEKRQEEISYAQKGQCALEQWHIHSLC